MLTNVITLLHEAMHVLYPVPGSTGSPEDLEAVWANIEEEFVAQFHEMMFIKANAAQDPALLAASDYVDMLYLLDELESQWDLRKFAEDYILPGIMVGKFDEYGTLLAEFDGDIQKMVESPHGQAILDRVLNEKEFDREFQFKGPKDPKQKLPIRKDFRQEILRSVEDL